MRIAIVFGATFSAESIYKEIKKNYEIIAYCDNDKNKWGEVMADGIFVVSPAQILHMQWDEIIIISLSSMNIIKQQLLILGIPETKINTAYIEPSVKAREYFLRDFATIICAKGLQGSVAEAGVFQGEYAKIINEVFAEKKLFLFDTFTGFDERDIAEEKSNFSNAITGHLNITSEEMVLNKMKYPNQCTLVKGYFPESAAGISEPFCFVNLDMDLYKPTLEGLRFFYPLMVKGGIIVIHDYFSDGYKGVNVALDEFISETKECIVPFPIGDHVSIAIQKN